jgi:hypothetical protein
MLSLGIGKEFLHNCIIYSFSRLNCYNAWRIIREYTIHHPPSISILFFIEKTTLQRLLQGVK